LLAWLRDYLCDRKQRVVLSGATSDIVSIAAGVPQGSILGPLLFLVYINDTVTDIHSPIRLFAHDTTLYIEIDDPQRAADSINADLAKIQSWANSWLVTFNPLKTESLLFSRKTYPPAHPNLYFNDTPIQEVSSNKHLDVVFSNNCSWHDHIDTIKKKAWKRLNLIHSFKFTLDRKSLEVDFLFIRPILEYADVVWGSLTQSKEDELEKIQLETARVICGATKLVSINNFYSETGLEPLYIRRRTHRLILFYKMYHALAPRYLSSLISSQVGNITIYNLRNSLNLRHISCRSQLLSKSFLPSTINSWTSLTDWSAPSLIAFKSLLSRGRKDVPLFYYEGDRQTCVYHARLRTHCSKLNEHLFIKT